MRTCTAKQKQADVWDESKNGKKTSLPPSTGGKNAVWRSTEWVLRNASQGGAWQQGRGAEQKRQPTADGSS